ncbi:MAG TPA: hypothetical protein VIM06_06155 [Rhodanobacter sp.]
MAGVGAMTLVGAAVGAWSGALVGFDVPDVVSRRFEDDIAAGRILLVLDGKSEVLATAGPAIAAAGATLLPFHAHTAMT